MIESNSPKSICGYFVSVVQSKSIYIGFVSVQFTLYIKMTEFLSKLALNVNPTNNLTFIIQLIIYVHLFACSRFES